MKRTFGIVIMVSLIYVAALIMGYLHYTSKEIQEIEQLRLSYAVDYASDAAVQAMLSTGNLDMDYSDHKSLNVDPSLALDTFIDVFCFNYDIGLSQENKMLIKLNYIPIAVVATYDGYYLAQPELVGNQVNYPENPIQDGDWDLIFGMKIPYTYSYNNVHYALNMGMDYAVMLSANQGLQRYNGMPPSDSGKLSREEGFYIINNNISMDMTYAIDKANETRGEWTNSFFIPNQVTTFSGANPIQGPSFLVLVQNLDLTTPRPIHAFTIAGSKIDYSRSVVGYEVNGTPYYCYADRQHLIAKAHGVAETAVIIKNMYSSPKIAAINQFYFDTFVDAYIEE
ncbi:hypothetical protein [Vallitalea okinawensis]|uniref:hypothetical protein n=1 Tax=Vallitalea okinawensis TaxID=2078660 RepID=UPI000CFD637B|nr:hypothetical protein [Vallitalea okinawensis]